jgi:hypothetical protein
MDMEEICKEGSVILPELHSAWRDRIFNVPVELQTDNIQNRYQKPSYLVFVLVL